MISFIIKPFFISCCFLFLQIITFSQAKDSVYAITTQIDTIKPATAVIQNNKIVLTNPVYGKVYDTLKLVNKQSLKAKSGSLYHLKDSLLKNQSTLNISKAKINAANDSVFRAHKALKARNDSLMRSNTILAKKNALLVQKNALLVQKNNARLDSLKRINWKKDSARIKENIRNMKNHLLQMQADSVYNARQGKIIPVTKEIRTNKNVSVTIDDLGRKLIIKTSNDSKVRLESSMNVPDDFNKKDTDLAAHLNINFGEKDNEIIIKKVLDIVRADPGRNIQPSLKTPVTITIPSHAKLTIKNRYADLSIQNDVKLVSLDLMNTKLTMQNAEKAIIKNRYGSIEARNIKDAELDLLNCRLSSGELGTLIMKSKYCNISFTQSETAEIHSISDEYKIASVSHLSISKSFGKLKIDELTNSFKLAGNSADVEINKIAPGVKLVQVTNKYAQVKLPVENLPNYSLRFDGTGNRVYAAFEIVKTVSADSPPNSNAFHKTMGNTQNNFTELVLNCSSCHVDFR